LTLEALLSDFRINLDRKSIAYRDPGRPPRGSKPPECPPLKPLDVKELSRQVRKFGPKVIAEATKKIPMRGEPGRPSGALPERVFMTQWIEERADERRRAGSRTPYKDAELDLYELQYGRDEHGLRDVQKFRKTIKKQRLRGRREWQEYAERVRRKGAVHFRKLPDWLKKLWHDK
jgi:hypothetical protein